MNNYEEMLYMDHPVSKKHPQMSLSDRAAQFSPFAALTGFEEATEETERRTDEKIILDESRKAYLNMQLQEVLNSSDRMAEITYFEADQRKAGGAYLTISEKILKFDSFSQKLIFMSGKEIEIDNIIDIQYL